MNPEPESPGSLCVLRLSALGDVCHTVPVVRALQRRWPECRITWIIGRIEHGLLGDLPGVEFITWDKRGGLGEWRRLRAALRGRRFDHLLMMQTALRASLISLAIPARQRIGFDRARARDMQWLFTDRRIAARRLEHSMEALFGFADLLGAPREPLVWDIPIPEEARAFARQHIPPGTPTLVLSPCSSQRARNFRNWSAARYAAVIDHAAARGVRTILTGGTTHLERVYAESISAQSRHPPLDLVGRTSLKQLLALIARARAVICPDSGPAHMGTAVGTPVIGLYASSNPARTGPYLSRRWTVDRYPDAVHRFLGRDPTRVRWGGRVRPPETMDIITITDVTSRLDALLDDGEELARWQTAAS